jgi:hypothetical protein
MQKGLGVIRVMSSVHLESLMRPLVNPDLHMMRKVILVIGRICCWRFVIRRVNIFSLCKNAKYLIIFIQTEVLGYRCPDKVEPGTLAYKFWPYPRFALPNDKHRLITCVNGYPRLISCGEHSSVNPETLTCEELL